MSIIMANPKITKIEVLNTSIDTVIDINLSDYDVSLTIENKGFYFKHTIDPLGYKVHRKEDYILLEKNDPNKKLTGVKKVMESDYRLACYGTESLKLQDQYGTMFREEVQTNGDIKLFPVHIEQIKWLRKEIIKLMQRYETENNLITE